MSESLGSVFDTIRALVLSGKEESYEALVVQHADALRKLTDIMQKVQRVAPDVALSPYVTRAIRVLREREVAQDGSIPAAA